MLKLVFILGFGGFLGTIGRYFTGHWLQQWISSSLPIGTFVVNIVGSFFLGFIYAIAEKNQWASPELRLFFTVGFCGGFTTFSTFSFDLLRLGTDYGLIYPLCYALASVTLGFLAVWGGTMVVRGL